jgi:hypothetical protein
MNLEVGVGGTTQTLRPKKRDRENFIVFFKLELFEHIFHHLLMGVREGKD